MKELYAIEKATLVAIADAIRQKKGTESSIPVSKFAETIASIESVDIDRTITPGTYVMVDYQYEGYPTGIFDWEPQELLGTYIEYYHGEKEVESQFTSVKNDSMYSIGFYNNDIAVSDIIPSWNPDYNLIKLIIEETQTVDKNFKTWFKNCFAIDETV